MQIYEYDTIKAKQLNILRSPDHYLRHKGWDGITWLDPKSNEILRFTAEVVKIDIFDLPQHINPVRE